MLLPRNCLLLLAAARAVSLQALLHKLSKSSYRKGMYITINALKIGF